MHITIPTVLKRRILASCSFLGYRFAPMGVFSLSRLTLSRKSDKKDGGNE